MNLQSLREWLSQINVAVYLLVCVFAISSWIDINGVWVELPLLVNSLPEGWNLPSYLVIIIQVANIGPIIYTVANRLAPNKVKEWPVVYIIIVIGAAACLLLAFFWNRTSVLFGVEHSTALLVLASFLSLVDCTSSVVFLPYMAVFKPQYMTAFYIGEGLSGFIPGIVGLIQGVGGDPTCVNTSVVTYNKTLNMNFTKYSVYPQYQPPLFSVKAFFFILFSMLCMSCIAFSLVNFAPFAKKETIKHMATPRATAYVKYEKAMDSHEMSDNEEGGVEVYNNQLKPPVTNSSDATVESVKPSDEKDRDHDGRDDSKPRLTSYQYVFLLAVVAWVNALTNGVLPSTQSYSALPYGNQAYTLSVRLSTLANPLACFIALLLPGTSLMAVSVLTMLGSGLAAYQLYLAATSPLPPLLGHIAGNVLVISTSVLLTGVLSYTKVAAASIFRREGRKALLWCGASTQVGSFVGAVVTFVLVNVLQLFQSVYACSS